MSGTDTTRQHIIIAGPFPPPVHGFSYITQELRKILETSHEVEIIDLAPHRAKSRIGYQWERLWLTLKGILTLFKRRSTPDRTFYLACEGNWELLYTIKLAAAARVLGYRLFIHHHSFGYIEERSGWMAWLLRVAGRAATHIFLCEDMARRFSGRYLTIVNAVVLPNSAFVDPVPVRPAARTSRKLTIGLLSNLTHDKGLGLFLDILLEAQAQKLDIAGVLAGPAQSDIERDAIESAGRDLGSMLTYLGPVYGAAKHDFFRAIDVFVFPTRYANEAQPTVLFEALAHGVPVLSYDRGCICSQVKSNGAVLARDGHFSTFALSWLKSWLAEPQTLAKLRLDAQTAFVEEHFSARQKVGEIFSDLDEKPEPQIA